MKMMKKKECFQVLDSIIGKIELLEETMLLQTNSHINQRLEQLRNRMDMIELHTNHVENRLLFYSDAHIFEEKVIS